METAIDLDWPGLTLSVADSVLTLPAAAWDALAGPMPMLRHAFFAALERHGCIGGQTGWQPAYLLARNAGELCGILPLFLKSHSWGEYVFDHRWAEAYARHGLDYYPRLVACVPFTPVGGPRLLTSSPDTADALLAAARYLARAWQVSSLHVLFPTAGELERMQQAGFLIRRGVQFHWRNRGYRDFEDFLDSLTSEKRKKIRQDRKKVAAAGVTWEWRHGPDMQASDWAFFYRCYAATYHQHYSTPYLNQAFFEELGAALGDSVVVMIGRRDGTPVAAALNLKDHQALYGRHWGALEFIPCCHFEAAYYQGIDYAIRHRLAIFEAGAQGEHKLARGFAAQTTGSAHWIAHGAFREAIGDYLQHESQAMHLYLDELSERAPFRASAPADGQTDAPFPDSSGRP